MNIYVSKQKDEQICKSCQIHAGMQIFNIKVNCEGKKIYNSGFLGIIAYISNQERSKSP